MTNKLAKNRGKRARRKMRIRKKINGTPERPRLAVSRSLKHIQAHLIDDTSGRALLGMSSSARELLERLDQSDGKCDMSREVGKMLAAKAQEAGISHVVFDRSGYLYHGRVKALAEGAREGGLKF